MTEYKIERFDPVMNGGKTASPMIYIKADQILLEFFDKNKNVVPCMICGTKTVYDGNIIFGVVNKGNADGLGLTTISLLTEWRRYPEYGSNGSVKFIVTD
jgi:hypothetical protein